MLAMAAAYIPKSSRIDDESAEGRGPQRDDVATGLLDDEAAALLEDALHRHEPLDAEGASDERRKAARIGDDVGEV